MDWAILIDMLIDMIKQCIENRNADDVRRRLRNPGFREALALRRILRKQGLSGKALHQQMRFHMADLKDARDDEIDALVVEAGMQE